MKNLFHILFCCNSALLATPLDNPGKAECPNAIYQQVLKGFELVHLQGSRLSCGTDLEKTMEMACRAGSKISLDLANTVLIQNYRERIYALLETYTDILFINEDESYALTQLPPDKSALFLKNFCPIVIIKTSSQGCWICSSDGLSHTSTMPPEWETIRSLKDNHQN